MPGPALAVHPRPARTTLRGLVRLVRPLNVVLFLVGVALGGLLAGGADGFAAPHAGRLALACVSAALIGAGANAVNDAYDLAIDLANRPDRPLPAGEATVGAAWALWAATTVLGVGLGATVSPLHLGIAGASAAVLWAYSAWLKRLPFVGNLAVAVVLGLALLYGGLAVGGWWGAAVGAAFAFWTTLAREVVKDVEDVAGDQLGGARTLATTAGPRAASRLGVGLVALAVAGLPAPLFLPALGASFLLWSLPAAAALLVAAWVLLAAPPDALPHAAGRSSAWLKGAMAAGIVALAAVRLGA